MNTDRLFKALSDIHPLPEEFKEELKRNLSFLSLPRHHFLLEGTTIAQNVFFLEKGFSISYSYSDGKRVITSFWAEGEIIFSPKSFYTQIPATGFIQLLEDSELYCISHESVQRLFDKFPVANFISHVISANYHHRSEQRLIELLSLSTWERYTKLLEAHPGIEQKVSQDIIASYLGIASPSLSRLKGRRNQF